MINPFATTSDGDFAERAVLLNGTKLIRSAFLYREIQFLSPFQGTLVYSGWWFRQVVQVQEQRVWFRISWWTFSRRIEFRIPVTICSTNPVTAIEIDFGRGLQIRRFRVWVAGQLAYDEIN